MTREPFAVLALALLLTLAGCGGGFTGGTNGGEGEASSTATLTPVPVPTETPVRTPTPTATPMPTGPLSTPGGALVVPGLTTGGVADPFRFADGHKEALRAGPYRVQTNTTLVREDGTVLYDRRETLHVGAEGRRYDYTVRTETAEVYPVTPFAPDIGLWYDGTVATFRVERNGSVRYERDVTTTGTGPVADLSGHDRIAGLASNADLRLVGQGIDERYRVAAQRFASLSVLRVPAFLNAPRDATLSMVVSPDGLVEQYQLVYTTTFEGERVRVVHRRTFSRAGAVTEPSWLPAAEDATGPQSLGMTTRRAVEES